MSQSEKRLKKRTAKHAARNVSKLMRKAEQGEQRSRDEHFRSQQEQTPGTLDTAIDAIIE